MIGKHPDRISQLLYKHIIGSISEDEMKELDAWRSESTANQQLFNRLSDMQILEKEYAKRRAINTSRPMADMQRRIRSQKKGIFGFGWAREFAVSSIAVAAVVIMLILIQAPGFKLDKQLKIPETQLAEAGASEIKPGETKATLVTEEGEKVVLSAEDGVNAKKIAESKTIAQAVATPQIRTLSLEVPRGGEFKIILEDSTEVWLNSQSQLKYPESFTKEERRVSVTGEAYFKVAKDERPFYVETYGQLVRVYGTEFNVRSYIEDPNIYTTLVHGSISLSKLNEDSGELMLTPGNQALFNKTDEYTSVKSVDTEVVTSWRQGRFVFEGQPLHQIMCDLSRWYSFEYEFKDENLKHIVFMGSLPRYSEFNTVLAILEKSGGLTFTIEGSKVNIFKK